MESEIFYKYLPAPGGEERAPLRVVDGGRTRIPPHTPYPPTRHPQGYHFSWGRGRALSEYQLVWITRGGGLFESKPSGPLPLVTGDVFVLFPGVWHRYAPHAATGWDEQYVGFRGPLGEELVRAHGLAAESPVRHVGLDAALLDLFHRIVEELRDERPGYRALLASLTVAALGYVHALPLRRGVAGSPAETVVQQAKAIMADRLHAPLDIEELARRLNVGYSWFRKAFRQYTGHPPAQYHLQLRIGRARELLRDTVLPIHRIALETGFDTPAYFSRCFKLKVGLSPYRYRARYQG